MALYDDKSICARWHIMPAREQLANIGSEFFRCAKWKSVDDDRFFAEIDRFVQYITILYHDPKWRGHRRRELVRIKDSVIECLTTDPLNTIEVTSLQSYFDQFAMLVRK